MNVFDVRVYQIRRRAGRRRPFEVRWHAAGQAWFRSFISRGLADNYRAELVRATRQGLEFDPASGEPVLWGIPPVPDITWYQHAVAFVDMKWPRLALILTRACPRTGSAWTSTGKPHEPRGLKHRPEGAIRVVPVPPVLVTLLRQHLQNYGTTPDGRLFRGTRGGMLSESVYGRAWHTARRDALGPVLAATPLARRPYDLRHAALSLWLTATGAPAEIAARAGNSVTVLHTVYTHRLYGQQDAVSQQIEHALNQQNPSPPVAASGSPNRSHHPNPVRYMSVNGPRRAPHQRPCGRKTRPSYVPHPGRLRRSNADSGRTASSDTAATAGLIWPTHGPQAVCGTACFQR